LSSTAYHRRRIGAEPAPRRGAPGRVRTLGRTGTLALAAALGVGALACAGDPGDGMPSVIQVEDRTGRVVRLEEPAHRIVSMVPAATEWLVAMGAADRLVARTDFDRDPALEALPSVGGLTPSVEWLISRRPDLVLAWADGPSRSTVARLEAVGTPVYVASAETVEEGLAIATDLGRLLGLEPVADSLIAAVRAGLDQVRRDADPRSEPSVLFLIELDPLTAAGPGTFVDELIRAAGGRNLLGDLRLSWPAVSLEEVLRRDPDIVLMGTLSQPSVESLRARPGWRDLAAIRRGRVHPVDPYVVNRWGPGLHESAALLSSLIHGTDR